MASWAGPNPFLRYLFCRTYNSIISTTYLLDMIESQLPFLFCEISLSRNFSSKGNMWILRFHQLGTTDLLNGVYILWYSNRSPVFFGHVLHVDNTVRRRLGLKATMCDVLIRWRHCTVPCVLSVGSVGSGSFPPALGAETLPRRVTIISTGILTQQLLLGNSDPSLFIRRRPHSRAFLTKSTQIGRNRKVQNPTTPPPFVVSFASFFLFYFFTSLASPTCSRTS